MHEYVKTGISAGQAFALQLTEENGRWQLPPDRGFVWSAADDRQLNARQRRNVAEQVEPLLSRVKNPK